jgi:hypothetical protein
VRATSDWKPGFIAGAATTGVGLTSLIVGGILFGRARRGLHVGLGVAPEYAVLRVEGIVTGCL